MGVKLGKAPFSTGPKEEGTLENLGSVIVDFINSANQRLKIAIQKLVIKPIIQIVIDVRNNNLYQIIESLQYAQRRHSPHKIFI